MLSLNIETSTNLTSVSLSEVNGVKEILNVNSERPNHCELLVPLITELFVKSSITIENINQIRVNVGPGNLSSLRVGISTANALSSYGRIPVYGISSFLLYGFSYEQKSENLVTLFDLKNDLFAYAKFKRSSDGIKLTEQNFKITLNDFSQLDMGDSIVIGSGLHKVQLSKFNKFPNFFLDNEFSIDSSSLAKININMNSQHISKNIPLMPFNSFSFVS
ncbi:MAG: tRNA (adenosine(37)-N6)-threonylcarbamoyltransferase complex dimerization subunit type 1 TsaB [Thermodesulfobacteriota bacterium]|nr:tRNA (adenosine(37)-N6)-threonylcarbamoyltransferase complex dimerization subunit type 1 TsaB [Deltaproteobacteria bacterium TMED58]RZP15810.1 MAG: tRNA (adenosine(37)-N6)-threonylcarbamoyltransferase complex dimerization subunit type 1 TsaB [Candidatus Dadabacteria bacterium]|tara:strand:- start:14885 stop:15541 length:657 start_codon:yes stop_codon:yes gene_type:complete